MERRVAIVGAGLAGLSCAHVLRKRGISATVFEAMSTAGGRSRIEHVEGFTIDCGAQYLLASSLFPNTFDLIRDIGLGDDIVEIPPHAGQLYKGRVYPHKVTNATGLLKFKGLGWTDKAMLPRMAYLMSKYGESVDFHHPERGLSHDDESVAAFVKRELSQNILNYVAGPLISTLFFYGSEKTSKLLYLMLAKSMYDTAMHTMRGGIGRIGQRLAEAVEVVTAAPISKLSHAADRFKVAGESFTDVVVAAPGTAVLGIDGLAEILSEEDRRFFRDCKYERAVTVMTGTEKPADGKCYGVSIPRVAKLSAASIAFHDYMDPSRVPAGHGLLAITGGGPSVTAEALVADLNLLYPERSKTIFTRTYEREFATPMFPPGRYRELAAFQQRSRIPGLLFCGDYLMGPFVEGAISTGMAAGAAIFRS